MFQKIEKTNNKMIKSISIITLKGQNVLPTASPGYLFLSDLSVSD
jgi:hypothetical protein